MADYTVLVETGEALVEMLRDSLTPEPLSDRELIALASPIQPENCQLTVHLFHMEEETPTGHPTFSQESPNRQRMGSSRFNLQYLITAHSKAPTHLKATDEQRVIGKVLQVVKDTPVIPTKYYKGSLEGSRVNLMLELARPTFEQLLKIWNNTSSPYKLSLVCKVKGVFVDSRRTTETKRVTDAALEVEYPTITEQVSFSNNGQAARSRKLISQRRK